MQLDAPVFGCSFYRYLCLLAVLLATMILGLRLSLAWWCYGLLIVAFGFLLWTDTYKEQLVHLVSPKTNKDKHWQCKVMTMHGEQLWQALPVRLTDYGLCVALSMTIVVPQPKNVRWLIFADMMSDEDYRRLKMLSSF